MSSAGRGRIAHCLTTAPEGPIFHIRLRLPMSTFARDDFEVLRDPLWNTIPVDAQALRIIDTPVFQRLRGIRQLGHAYLVYPGANHTRFDHAVGVYHLARRTLGLLGERDELRQVDPLDCRLIPYAALLHDIGHYPFSHALEELGTERIAGHHEDLAERFLEESPLREVLEEISNDAPGRIAALIRGQSDSPLQGLIAGSLDLDKIEYLNRDAMFCGVPYGNVDMERLVHAITLLRDPISGRLEIGIHEKGLSALESLLFAKYQMFRNVYWHHAIRAATAVYKRAVEYAVDAGLVQVGELVGRTDEGLLTLLEERAARSKGGEAEALLTRWIPALRYRRLPKRALEIPGDALRESAFVSWFYDRPELSRRLEDRIAAALELPPGGVFIDYPEKPGMLGLGLLLLQREGKIVRLEESGQAGFIDLPRISDELYHSARVFRIFTTERKQIPEAPMLALLTLSAGELAERLQSNQSIL